MSEKDSYKVGYKKPPAQSQFKKGSSGNRKGRPHGTRNLRTELTEELAEPMVVREGGRTLRVSKQRAVVKSLLARTLKGEARAANILLNLILRLSDPKAEEHPEDGSLTPHETETLEIIHQRLISGHAPAPVQPKHEEGEEGK